MNCALYNCTCTTGWLASIQHLANMYKSITLLWHLLTCDSSWKRPAACRSLECTSPAGAPSYKQAIIPHLILHWMLSQDVSSILYVSSPPCSRCWWPWRCSCRTPAPSSPPPCPASRAALSGPLGRRRFSYPGKYLVIRTKIFITLSTSSTCLNFSLHCSYRSSHPDMM